MNFSAWAINRPIPSILFFILLVIAGLIGFYRLPIQQLPETDFPVINVVASLPGASPTTLENEVTRRIENSVSSLGGIRHINSTVNDGISSTSVTFELEKPSQEAMSDVRNAIESIRSELPSEMQAPIISRLAVAGSDILTFSVESEVMDESELSWFVDNEVSKRLLIEEGIGDVSRVGGVRREIRIELDPVKLEALNITTAEVSGQLKYLLKDAPGGRSNLGGMEQSIRTISAIKNREEIESLTLSLASGQAVQLRSVAEIYDTSAFRDQLALVDGQAMVTFSIKRARGAGEVAVAKNARFAIEELVQQFPHVKFKEVNETITPILNSYHAAMYTLYEGAILAILAVWLFLRNWRSTLVAAVALPLSVIPTFAFIYALDFQLNMITLLGLTLIIGVLVDDAIVEIENIERHLELGLSPRDASLVAANEIGLSVIATTFTLIAVFLPTAFMSGIAGTFFKQFGWTTSIAVLFSLLVARLITPMMAAVVMKANPPKKREKRQGGIKKMYISLVKKGLKYPFTTVLSGFAFLILSLVILLQLPTNFVDADDTGQILVTVESQPGSKIDDTANFAEQVRKVISTLPEVVNVYTTIGAGSSPNVQTAKLVVSLTKIAEHNRRTQQELESVLRDKLQNISGARISVGGNSSGQRLDIVLKGDNSTVLSNTAQTLVKELRSIPNIGNVLSSASLMRPEIFITPNYDRAAELGVTTDSISTAIRLATASDYDQNLPRLNLPDRQINVRTQISLEDRSNLETIKNLKVRGHNGLVPLLSVADISFQGGPTQIDRLDRTRIITVTIDTLNKPLGEVKNKIESVKLLHNLPGGIQRIAGGESEQQEELFVGFGFAMLAGILCVYAVLVLLFHDFLQPLTILVAIPLSAGGAFLALALLGYSLSLSSLIGLIMLMGIVSKNSILLVDFAKTTQRETDMTRTEAIIDACSKRSRPIIMTSFAMIAGMLPMALQLGVPSAFRGSMAVAVIGGLITSTALSLVIVPAVYELIDDFKIKLKSLFTSKT